MHILIIYDITKTKLRSKITSICFDYGLKRVQKSAFLGLTTARNQQWIIKEVRELLDQKGNRREYNIQIFQLPVDCMRNRTIFYSKKRPRKSFPGREALSQ